ncbi:hypothetical protein [Rhodopirellula baltica]
MKLLLGFLCLLLVRPASADLVISGVSDGTDAGGNPKSIELVALTPIADLSNFFILRDTNGSTDGVFSVSSDFQLPAVSLDVGEFFYIYGNNDSEATLEGLGFGDTDSNTATTSSIASINGDDIFAVSSSLDTSGVIDTFGLAGQGDTNFYEDSIAYRKAGSGPNPTGVLDGGNFDISGYSEAGLNSNFGTFQVTAVPEPSIFGCLAVLAGAGFYGRARRGNSAD